VAILAEKESTLFSPSHSKPFGNSSTNMDRLMVGQQVRTANENKYHLLSFTEATIFLPLVKIWHAPPWFTFKMQTIEGSLYIHH
jgi:hypothetical protein